MYNKISLHDTCGVHNLHGMPGIISGLFSVLMCYLASEDTYGPSLYLIFPRSAPHEGSSTLRTLQEQLPNQIAAGENRSMGMQALMQLAALIITIVLALVSGSLTGT